MARTALFSRLRSVVSRLAPAGPELGRSPAITRRHLLRAGAGLGVLACGPQSSPAPLTPRAPSQRVAVIGGGLAGLHCAYRLAQAGVDVTVYEANARIGGRTFSGRKLFRDPKLTCELGAELIDGDHLTMQALAQELNVSLDPRYGSAESALTDTYWLQGREVAEALIESQLGEVAPAILAALSRANGDASVFRDLDNSTVKSFLEQNVPVHKFPELSLLLETAFRSEFGLEPDQQSALILVHLMVASEGATVAPFDKQRTQFRARLGADSFATAFSSALRDRVKLGSKLASIRATSSSAGNAFSLAFETETASGFATEAEHVVFALPFSVLRELDLTSVSLSEPKRKLIRDLGYGSHGKLFGAFVKRIWRDLGKNGSVSSDLPFQQVWDASIGQGDVQGVGVLANLLGGDAGEDADLVGVQQSMAALLADLDGGRATDPAKGALPGVSGAFIAGSALRMHWPSAPLFRGSYACYLPGQWTLRGHEGRREGNLHFCGEHCSADFQGRMEGAAETGALVAARLLNDLHVAWPTALAAILAPKLVVEQPCYDGTVGAALGFLERRATLARQALPDGG
jgi:monoamine oxidase